ncbi:hypothetical protein [Bradyrhizobium sp. Ash2021]|uniref:hypothetical protein n=1 Tax=Bradyrhizobium sp. Ash2021 TaxID=2954771 RepID=UPI0028160CCF|nr:hypothetical protein [Bradyrhizobium sp. Ash2021]WMT71325.1 hypothetical protein NL528_24850 [Bradyrhizobium sp. Ash2021]
MTYDPEFLKRWTMPPNYFGAVWPAYYSSGVGQSRDSVALERSNFTSMLRDLGGESETVIVVRESHWLVGWVEWIAIHESDDKALAIADDITGKFKRSASSKKKPTQSRRTATTRKSGSTTPADAAGAPLVSGHDPVADR